MSFSAFTLARSICCHAQSKAAVPSCKLYKAKPLLRDRDYFCRWGLPSHARMHARPPRAEFALRAGTDQGSVCADIALLLEAQALLAHAKIKPTYVSPALHSSEALLIRLLVLLTELQQTIVVDGSHTEHF